MDGWMDGWMLVCQICLRLTGFILLCLDALLCMSIVIAYVYCNTVGLALVRF